MNTEQQQKTTEQNFTRKKNEHKKYASALSHGETLLYLTALKSQLFELVEFKFSTMTALHCRCAVAVAAAVVIVADCEPGSTTVSLARSHLPCSSTSSALLVSLFFYYDKFLGLNAPQEPSGKQ